MILLDLYLTRHGQSWGNIPPYCTTPHLVKNRPPGIETGRMEDDWCLTELGQRQAEALGERLSAVDFDAIWSSPLERAHATAKAVQARQAQPVEIKLARELMEIFDYGDTTPEEWHTRSLQMTQALQGGCPPGARMLVVAHGAFNSYLLTALLGLPGPERLLHFWNHNTGLTRIVFSAERDMQPWDCNVRLYHLNDLSHLAPELITE